MSIAVKEALLQSHDLGKNERLVLLTLAAHANENGDAWPSVATIARYVGCSERTVQRALAKLVELGRLAVRQVARIATRVYRFVTQGVTDQAEGVTSRAPGGDTQTVTRSEDHGKTKKKSWRNFLPKNHPERRGAALPPPPGGDRCQKPGHVGQVVGRCIPCRSEALGGAA
ncbi:AraC-like DNA-binding protein [Micromonospora sp. A200]|uniref:helix-turn-helix domain-containing protein n=1 Tax=Micromonospora sp. A200 TaxID=2940568 RepID=UPI002476F47A|nr:helix-turn-helix domain-containing protein [Micromonospora sp. A200]MDH6462023.1 AraC-like DNA-binding protein [Micromonospora sp. A200]